MRKDPYQFGFLGMRIQKGVCLTRRETMLAQPVKEGGEKKLGSVRNDIELESALR
jgi:hypothetical protein